MKEFNLLVWLTQLGMSIALPMGGFIWGAVWLRDRFGLGKWVVICGCVIGLICAIDGVIHSFQIISRIMHKQDEESKKELKTPLVSFNEHD